MSTYYIDAFEGSDKNDGLSPKTPKSSELGIAAKPGDKILFKRGTLMRRPLAVTSGNEDNPITYGAYGEGDKPVFCGSVNMSDAALWTEEKENIWFCDKVDYEACNFIFDYGESYGTLKWNLDELQSQGDFYDNNFGMTNSFRPVTPDHRIYMYSEGNPALIYKDIECAVAYDRVLAKNVPHVSFENIRFLNAGMHAIAGDSESKNIRIHNCDFVNIGGCVWNNERRIRFGNAVEFWNVAENIEITHCYFDNIYDSATSHQGDSGCKRGENIHIDNNVFLRVGMGAYELRNRIPANSSFSNNICAYAGEGFSKNGVVMPRNSEIWPEPMGHHIFMWRVDSEYEGVFEIKNNIFDTAPYGACIYSVINPDCEKFVKFAANTYYTDNADLIVRLNGRNYSDFCDYHTMEPDSKYEKSDVETLVCKWKNTL